MTRDASGRMAVVMQEERTIKDMIGSLESYYYRADQTLQADSEFLGRHGLTMKSKLSELGAHRLALCTE